MFVVLLFESLVVLLLAGLLVGLLRNHAEVLRRLAILEERRAKRYQLPGRDGETPTAKDIAGETLNGGAVQIPVATSTEGILIAFLSSGCSTCAGFWQALREEGPATLSRWVRIVIVTRDRNNESPSVLSQLAPKDIELVMSSDAWTAYDVPASPYFYYVREGMVAGEGTAVTWQQVKSLFRDYVQDLELTHDYRRFVDIDGRSQHLAPLRGPDDIVRDDQELAESGITPDHPSLVAPLAQSLTAPIDPHPSSNDRRDPDG